MEQFLDTAEDLDVEKLRSELEQELHTWSHPLEATAEEVSETYRGEPNFMIRVALIC